MRLTALVACGLGLGVQACSAAARSPSAASSAESRSPLPDPSAFDAKLQELCTGPASVPMEIAGSREFVSVALPGSKTPGALRFHVDSGGNTPGLMVLRSAIERLGFTSAAALPRTVRIGERDVPLPEGADWLVLDDRDDESSFDRAARKDFSVGQLGAGFLSRFVVCIDPEHRRLGLGDPTAFNLVPGEAPEVPLLLLPSGDNHALYPFVRLLLRDRGNVTGDYGVLLDTGATTSMLDRDKIDAQRSRHAEWGMANGAFGDADMVGGVFREKVLAVPDVALSTAVAPVIPRTSERSAIDLGPARFVDRSTGTWSQMFGDVLTTGGSHGALANDVLLRYRLVLDYPHARLFVRPVERPRDESASSARVGLAIRFGADGCPEIRQITDTNEQQTRGRLQVGDVLLAIDGKNTCTIWHHEIQATLAGSPGTVKRLRVRRTGSDLEVEAVTAELLPSRRGE